MNGYNNFEETGRWEIEALFSGRPGSLALYEAFEAAVLARHPGTEIRPTKTQVGFFDGCCYAIASPLTRWKRKYPGAAILITLGLPERVESPRMEQATEPYPGRWTHHLVLTDAARIDKELLCWLDAAHQFAQMKRRSPSRKGER